MRQINKIVKSYKHLVFLDFEGTQYSHEIIAIGATVASIKSNGHIKKYYASFKRYVKPKNPIGNFVTKLTGITEDKIKSDGIRFSVMLEDFKNILVVNLNPPFLLHLVTMIIKCSLKHVLII